ncbi:MAG: hypothetical protein D6780_04780 [Candidatus Dadabacteria bacterium]|nr:MAG: hypothetical protein D6780_04780 [Candidatus Dadabacteria bacterium]
MKIGSIKGVLGKLNISSELSAKPQKAHAHPKPKPAEKVPLNKGAGDAVVSELSSNFRPELSETPGKEKSEKIKELKEKIESGEYKIETREVAKKLAAELL